jgi:hypothetical protein
MGGLPGLVAGILLASLLGVISGVTWPGVQLYRRQSEGAA